MSQQFVGVKDTMDVATAGRLAMRIRREQGAVLIDGLRPIDQDGHAWEIVCHHLGHLGSFILTNEADWRAKKAQL